MRVILSRKGFDSGAGGVPSPIIDGRPVSMPIPQEDLGVGDVVERITRGRLSRHGTMLRIIASSGGCVLSTR